MSPLTLRRYRAERLLRKDFEGLRGRVIATVRGRLGASGASLDLSDLEACYAQAWQGLYAAVLEGQEIANPGGWLTVVTFRRAIEELRARRHLHPGGAQLSHGGIDPDATAGGAADADLAAELDDRIRLRQLFEGLRGRLSAREREAAALCYLQGLSRSQAAARMGISEARMRKLMDGRGTGRPGVAGKVDELAETIRVGGFCEEQGSLMRGLAYGVLDPNGERYRLAMIHRSDCPACRAYVLSLRGLATVLPPVLLPWALGAEVLARTGTAHVGASIGAHPGVAGQGGAAVGAGAQGGGGLGGALTASGAAGVGGAAGGSWLWAGGPLGAKLAVGCLLALGVGAGCVALSGGPGGRSAGGHSVRAGAGATQRVHAAGAYEDRSAEGTNAAQRANAPVAARQLSGAALTPAARAAREFGPEQGPTAAASGSASRAGGSSAARLASAAREARRPGTSTGGSSSAPAAPSGANAPSAGRANATGAGAPAAAREFGIG